MVKQKYQKYINDFRRKITPYLKSGVGLLCKVYPSRDGSAVIEFSIGLNIENDDIYNDVSDSIGSALSKVEQRAFGGNLDGFTFKGTNTILEENRIIYIKEDDLQEWSEAAAEKDVSAIVTNARRNP